MSNILEQASLVLIPSGYKSGKIYSQIPTSGDGDLQFTRASDATRVNGDGEIESVATGVPRLDYSQGTCPALLLEPQRTNGVRNSVGGGSVAGTPGTNPTNWTINTQAGLAKEIVGTGTENGLPYVDVRYSGTPTGGIFFLINFEATNIISATSGQTWAYSFYFKKVSGTIPSNVIQMVEYNASGIFLANSAIVANLNTITTLTRINGTRTLTNALTAFTGIQIRIDAAVGVAYDFTMRFAAPQIELGAYATSYIPTTTVAVTRIADAFTRDNIYTNNLITSSGGTWFVELRNNLSYLRDAFSPGLFIADNAISSSLSGNGFIIRQPSLSSQRLIIQNVISGVNNQIYTTTTNITKIAIKWNGSTADVFENGTKVVSAIIFTTTNMNFLNCGATDVPKFIQQMALFPSALSDSNCQLLTT
jgi:hypothetical protein